jgi:anti-sigma factor RsiW
MSKPPSWTAREESLLLLNAYLDHELDAAAVLDVERRISADATLKAEYDRLLELRTALASHLTKDRASDTLRERIAAIAAPSRLVAVASPRLAKSYDWRQMAAAAIIAAGLASSGTYLTLHRAAPTNEIAAIVAGHQRALLATAPFDVASSDRHTVKPWFDGKLALSPLVFDLSDAGFPLVGGRVDVVDGKAVPAIVYRRRAHVISVVAIPQPGNKDTGEPPTLASRDGYSVLRWPGHDFEYSAISDIPESELAEFVMRWRSDASAN